MLTGAVASLLAFASARLRVVLLVCRWRHKTLGPLPVRSFPLAQPRFGVAGKF